MNIFQIPTGYENDDFCCPYCGFIENTPPKVATHLPPGTELSDRFIIGTVLGAGGFGVTYKAWNKTLETVVAIKEYFPRSLVTRGDNSNVTVFSSKERGSFEHGIERFLREARSLVKFNNEPGTAFIYDFFEENGTAYIVMEYLDGCTMEDYFQQNGVITDMNMIKDMSESICDVLEKVHSTGLIHGDISPDNIFRCNDGTYKLIDFGAMKHNYAEKKISSTVLLKHGYAPTEHYSKSGNVGPWTDVYSFGATLYFLLTGKLPPDSFDRFQNDELINPKEINPVISDRLNDTIVKAMSVQIEDRYQNIKELREDILSDSLETNDKGINEEEYDDADKDEIEKVADEIKPEDSPSENQTLHLDEEQAVDVNDNNIFVDTTKPLSPNKPSKNKMLIAIIIAAVIALFLFGGTLVYKKMNKVPNVEGMNYTYALDLLESKGYRVSVVLEIDDQEDWGTVKTETNKRKDVTITVSTPDVKGFQKDEALQTLEALGFDVCEDYVFSDDIPKDQVIEEKITDKSDSNTQIVELVISKGPKKIKVPDVVGKNKSDAKTMIEEKGLKIKFDYKYSDKIKKDIVISQSIKADSKCLKGDLITVVISKGPEKEMITVPDVVGKTKEEAEKLLKDLKIEYKNVYSSTVKRGKIISQDPEKDTKVEKGSTITLKVSLGKKPAKASYYEDDDDDDDDDDDEAESEEQDTESDTEESTTEQSSTEQPNSEQSTTEQSTTEATTSAPAEQSTEATTTSE